jgi:drug/metabolite transporter (DMT)-like permease
MVGIALVTGAVACFATLDTTTRFVSTGVPLLMALWFRYAFQALSTTLVVFPLRGMRVLRTANFRYHALRGLLLMSATMLAFVSLKYTPVAEFTAIVMITPLVITLVSAFSLGEPVSPVRWILVIGGFAGTLMIVRPQSDDFNWALLLPVTLVGINVWFQLLTSKMARTEDPMTTHLYTGWVGTLVATCILPFVWTQIDSPAFWGGLILMGFMGTIGHFLLILAYQRASAVTLTPYLYGQIGFAMLGGWLVFSHIPDGWSLAGIGMITLCGALSAWLTGWETRQRLVHRAGA